MGIYSLAAYRVAQRRQEFALKAAAVGASPMRLLGDMVREAAHLVAAAVLLGTVGVAATGPLLRGLSSGVPGLEARTYAWTAAVVINVTLAATIFAAPRVAVLRLNPIETLRPVTYLPLARHETPL